MPKARLEAMYEAAVAEPYSFLYIYLLNPLHHIFHIHFERLFHVGNPPATGSDGAAAGDGLQQAAGQLSRLRPGRNSLGRSRRPGRRRSRPTRPAAVCPIRSCGRSFPEAAQGGEPVSFHVCTDAATCAAAAWRTPPTPSDRCATIS